MHIKMNNITTFKNVFPQKNTPISNGKVQQCKTAITFAPT